MIKSTCSSKFDYPVVDYDKENIHSNGKLYGPKTSKEGRKNTEGNWDPNDVLLEFRNTVVK